MLGNCPIFKKMQEDFKRGIVTGMEGHFDEQAAKEFISLGMSEHLKICSICQKGSSLTWLNGK